MQAEATAPTPPNSQVRRASPAAAGEGGAGRFGAALKSAQGRAEGRVSVQGQADPEAAEVAPQAPGAPPQSGVDSPATPDTVQPAPPNDDVPLAGEASPPAGGEAAAGSLAAVLPAATFEPVAATPSPVPPVIAPPIEPTTSLSPATIPGGEAPVVTVVAVAETATPPVSLDPTMPQPRAAAMPTASEAPSTPTMQAGPGTALPGDIPQGSPTTILAAATEPPVAGANIGPGIASPPAQPASATTSVAIEAATIGLDTPGIQAAAAAPTTRPARPPPAGTVATGQPALPMEQPPISPGIATESSVVAAVPSIPASAGLAVQVSDGGDPLAVAGGMGFDAVAAGLAATPGPTPPEKPGIVEGTASTTPAPDTPSTGVAPSTLPAPVASAVPERPVRPPRQTPAGQIVPVAIALALGSEARSSITVSLDPIELGRVDVRVERMGDIATVQVIAERPETLLLLQRDQATLDRALADAGIGGGGRSLSFSLGGEGRGAQDRARRPAAVSQGITDIPAHVADQRGAGRPRALLDIAV